MGISVWKMLDFRMEVATRILALAHKFEPRLGLIELFGGSSDETAESFLLGLDFSWLPLLRSRGKASVWEGIGCIDTWNPRGAGARSQLSGSGRRYDRWSKPGAFRGFECGAPRGLDRDPRTDVNHRYRAGARDHRRSQARPARWFNLGGPIWMFRGPVPRSITVTVLRQRRSAGAAMQP
jgi:hypothetical protein